MTKRILLALAALLFPLVAFAEVAGSSRDILLANDGTLYTVESVAPESLENVTTTSGRLLTLTVQNGDKSVTAPVPASLTGGVNIHPALAYDPDSKTLFVFWETARNNGFASDLLFCSYQNGTWGKPTSLDPAGWTIRQNLRIAITRKTTVEEPAEGEAPSINEVNVHAVWYQDAGDTQVARYAMLTVSKGDVTSIFVANATDFLKEPPAFNAEPVTTDLNRFPSVLQGPANDTVDLVFGDTASSTMHVVTIKPVASIKGRLRIPIGVKERELPQLTMVVPESAEVSAMSAGGDAMAFYYSSDKTLKYYTLKDGKWTSQSLALSTKVTRDAAVEALRRMVASQ